MQGPYSSRIWTTGLPRNENYIRLRKRLLTNETQTQALIGTQVKGQNYFFLSKLKNPLHETKKYQMAHHSFLVATISVLTV
jgi:hypothetical protein